MSNTSPRPKPCPMCGRRAFVSRHIGIGHVWWSVECRKGCCVASAAYKDTAIERWNESIKETPNG